MSIGRRRAEELEKRAYQDALAKAVRGEVLSGEEYVTLWDIPSTYYESAGWFWFGYRMKPEYREALRADVGLGENKP